jgi:hypothetical protein
LTDQFATLHGVLVQELLDRIRSGEATPSDLNVARQLLKDNNIVAAPNNKPVLKLADRIPQFGDPDQVPAKMPKQA